MNQSLQFRRAQADEAESLTAIAIAAKQHWGYPAEWMDEWHDELTVTEEYINTQPVVVAVQQGKIVGFVGFTLQKDGVSLDHLWLRPANMGQGIGRALFMQAVKQARVIGADELRIKSDPHAELFYLKMGAVRTGREEYLLLGKIHREVPLLIFYIR